MEAWVVMSMAREPPGMRRLMVMAAAAAVEVDTEVVVRGEGEDPWDRVGVTLGVSLRHRVRVEEVVGVKVERGEAEWDSVGRGEGVRVEEIVAGSGVGVSGQDSVGKGVALVVEERVGAGVPVRVTEGVGVLASLPLPLPPPPKEGDPEGEVVAFQLCVPRRLARAERVRDSVVVVVREEVVEAVGEGGKVRKAEGLTPEVRVVKGEEEVEGVMEGDEDWEGEEVEEAVD